MPNLRGMSYIPGQSISLTGSDGRTVTITKAQFQAWYQAASGSASAKLTSTINSAKAAIVAALGAEQVDTTLIDIVADATNGITSHTVRS